MQFPWIKQDEEAAYKMRELEVEAEVNERRLMAQLVRENERLVRINELLIELIRNERGVNRLGAMGPVEGLKSTNKPAQQRLRTASEVSDYLERKSRDRFEESKAHDPGNAVPASELQHNPTSST